MKLVYVINKYGKPLMPTQRAGKVRRLLNAKLAKVIEYEPFTIQLLYDTTDFIQELNLGVDTGSRNVGCSVTSVTKEVFAALIILRTDISKLLSDKRMRRRARRNRLRYRQAKFSNRVHSKKKGWLPPSIQHRIESHIRIMKYIQGILPIKNIYIELTEFDTQKMTDEFIESEEYQRGNLLGFKNVKEFVKWRDNFTCQNCHGKSGDNKLEVHHIQQRKDMGSDRPDNLVCLCHTCHEEYHQGKITLKKFSYLNRKNAASLRDAAIMNVIKTEIYNRAKEEFKDCNVYYTYGYITKHNRQKYNIEKSHCADARVISKNFNAEPLGYYYYGKFFRRHNRQIYKDKIIKGGRRVKAQANNDVYGFYPYHRVKYNKTVCFTSGRRTSGSFELKKLDNTVVHTGISYKKIKKIHGTKRLIFSRFLYRG